ncbi:MAG: hypothetical protein V1838_02945 [Patescibacteria group bacterium]
MKKTNNQGVSVIEIIIVIGMATILITSIGSAMAANNRLNNAGEMKSQALAYAKESMEIITEIKNDAFVCSCPGGNCPPTGVCLRPSDSQSCNVFSGYSSCWTVYAVGLTTNAQLHLALVGSNWQLAPGRETITADPRYTREVSVSNLQRDSYGAIVESGGTVDSNTKQVSVTVSWQENNQTREMVVTTILTAWQNI